VHASQAVDPGAVLVEKTRVLVGTGTDPVELSTVRAAGRRQMPAVDWARGTRAARFE
jgi:methionyl-tRNA formyltransferase